MHSEIAYDIKKAIIVQHKLINVLICIKENLLFLILKGGIAGLG